MKSGEWSLLVRNEECGMRNRVWSVKSGELAVLRVELEIKSEDHVHKTVQQNATKALTGGG